tara:strand:+ start:51 stop:224 length:174 start_codon:yes stop_codon:yes gene_type:complete
MKYKIMIVKRLGFAGDGINIIDPEQEYTLEEIQAFKKGVEEVQSETTKCYIVLEGEE